MAGNRKLQRRGYQSRRTEVREPLQRFLLVCEGERTEPAYFDGFRVPSLKIVIVGLGKDPLTLIERAYELSDKEKYDQIWCIFDKDEVTLDRFNQALALARRYKMKVAYSNQAFELWYLLHFYYCDTALSRHNYVERLSRYLGREYRKNDNTLYQELLSKQSQALQNAKRLIEQYKPRNPANDDPSTTVYQLVEELNRFTQLRRFT